MAETNGASSDVPPSSDPQHQPQTPPPSHPAATSLDSTFQANSLVDAGLSKRPRDARLIHMILANLGVNAYQERVPLQLMDFAYRYTSSALTDALHLTSEAYGTPAAPPGKTSAINNDIGSITATSLRLSIESRTHYQFNPSTPKEHLMEMAQERNRIALPPVGKDWAMKLPPERYCLTGVGWGIKEEWDSEGDVDVESGGENGDIVMGDDGDAADDEDGDDKMEDIFGEDKDMEDD